MGDAGGKLKGTKGLGAGKKPRGYKGQVDHGLSRKVFFLSSPAFYFSVSATTFLAFHFFSSSSPPWEKAEAQGVFWSAGYQHLYILLSNPHASTSSWQWSGVKQGWGPHLAGARQAGPSSGPHSPHTQLGHCTCDGETMLSQRERRADTAKYVRAAGESATPQWCWILLSINRAPASCSSKSQRRFEVKSAFPGTDQNRNPSCLNLQWKFQSTLSF